jgi:hypothetical protein
MYSGGLQKRKILGLLSGYLVEEKGLKIVEEPAGDFDLVAEDSSGLRYGFIVVEGAGRVEDKILAAGRVCYKAPYDRVYIVIDRRAWLKLTGLRELKNHFKEVYQAGLLVVSEEGVLEIFSAPRRGPKQPVEAREGPVREEPPASPVKVPEERRVEKRTVEAPHVEEETYSIEAKRLEEEVPESPKTEDLSGLPSFIQDNPWLRILSRERKR